MSIVSRILALVSSVGADIKDLYQKYTNLAVGRVVYLPIMHVTVAEDTYTLNVDYTPGMIRVSHTGALLRGGGVDYTATNGTTIVFNFELKAGDEVDIERISIDNTASPVTVGGIVWHPSVQINVDTVTNTIPFVYNPGAIRVSHTGILLRNGEDYTATSGTEIVFTNPLAIGDEIDIERITVDSSDQPLLADLEASIGDLTTLTTTDKSNLVDAINEVKAGAGSGGVNHEIFTVVGGRNDVPLAVTIGSLIPGSPDPGLVYAADMLAVNLNTGDIYKLSSGNVWVLDSEFTTDGIRSVNVLYGANTTNNRAPGLRIFKRIGGVTSMVITSMSTTGILHLNGTKYSNLSTLIGDLNTLNSLEKGSLVSAINSVLAVPALSGMPVSVWDVVNSRSANATDPVVLGDPIPGAPNGVVWAEGQRRLDEENGNIYTVDSGGNMGGEDFFNPFAIRLVNVKYGLNTASATPAGLRIANDAGGGFSVQTIMQNTAGITHARGNTYAPLVTQIGDLADLTTTDKTSIIAAINELKAASGGGGTPVDVWITHNARSTSPTSSVVIGNPLPGAPSTTLIATGQYRLNTVTGDIYIYNSDGTVTLQSAMPDDSIRFVSVLWGSGTVLALSAGLYTVKKTAGVVTTLAPSSTTTSIYHSEASGGLQLSAFLGSADALSTTSKNLVGAINELAVAAQGYELKANKDIAGGYAGLSSLGRVSKTAMADVMYNELMRAFDNDQNYDPTFVATASGTNGRPVSAINVNGFDMILTNGGQSIRYKKAADSTFTTDTFTTTVVYGKVLYLNGRLILLNADANTTVCAVSTNALTVAPSWTNITHTSVTAKWYDGVYVSGYYYFVGSDGNITRTNDFVSWASWKVDPLVLTTGYDIWSIIYQPATNSLLYAGCSAVAGSRTNGLFAGRGDITTPGSSITWNNSSVSNGESLRHCATRVYLINNDSGLNTTVVMHLHNPDDGYTYGTRLAFSNNNGSSYSMPSGFLSKPQEDQGPYTSGVWQVFWNSQYKTYMIFPQHPIAINTSIPWSTLFYIPVRTTASINIESLVKSKVSFNQHAHFVQIDSNNYVRYLLVGGTFRKQLFSMTDYAQRTIANIDGRDLTAWSNGSNLTKDITLRVSNGPLEDRTLCCSTSTLRTLNVTTGTAAGTSPGAGDIRWNFNTTNMGGAHYPPAYSAGRYYFEVEFITGTPSADTVVGLAAPTFILGSALANAPKSGSNGYVGYAQTGIKMSGNSSNVSSLPAWNTVGDVLCVAVDIENNSVWFRVNNGNWNNSATADPVKGTEPYVFVLESMARLAPFIVTNAISAYSMRFYRGDWTKNVPATFGEFRENSPSARMVPRDVLAVASKQGQRMTFSEGLWKNKFDFEVNPPNSYATTKDGSGIYTVVEVKHKDGRLAARSTLSGGTSPNYTTRTVNYYDIDGTTVYGTQVYTLTYDGSNLISEVLN